MNTAFPKFVGITDLRIKTKEIFDLVKNKNLPIIVMRESTPEAVIIPFSDYDALLEEKKMVWNKRLDELARQTKPYVMKWLQKKGYKPGKVTGDQLVDLLEKEDASRS